MTIGDALEDALKLLEEMPASRARSLAITKLEECALWVAIANAGLESSIRQLTFIGRLEDDEDGDTCKDPCTGQHCLYCSPSEDDESH